MSDATLQASGKISWVKIFQIIAQDFALDTDVHHERNHQHVHVAAPSGDKNVTDQLMQIRQLVSW
jgi:hypothetical protein